VDHERGLGRERRAPRRLDPFAHHGDRACEIVEVPVWEDAEVVERARHRDRVGRARLGVERAAEVEDAVDVAAVGRGRRTEQTLARFEDLLDDGVAVDDVRHGRPVSHRGTSDKPRGFVGGARMRDGRRRWPPASSRRRSTVWNLTAPLRAYHPRGSPGEHIDPAPEPPRRPSHALRRARRAAHAREDLQGARRLRAEPRRSAPLPDPRLGQFLKSLSVVGSRERCSRLKEEARTCSSSPAAGARSRSERGEAYKLIWKERTGFARMAIEHGYIERAPGVDLARQPTSRLSKRITRRGRSVQNSFAPPDPRPTRTGSFG